MKVMKKLLSVLFALMLLCGGLAVGASAAVDITGKFTDANFRAEVYRVIWKTAPAPILDTDVAGILTLDVSGKEIASLAGLEYFTGLTWLDCSRNKLKSLPSLPSGLSSLGCNNNLLESIDVTGRPISILRCGQNYMKRTSDVKGFTGTWDGVICDFDPQNLKLWGKYTEHDNTPLNWFLLIVCFGWIWMAF